ncbi:hypothetical protein GUITHDRAFT_94912 [Guillardia theta CCMP2712]|uniref:Protein kinase domain-containing protein n=1 Tax=Guillardia theta (strain CCMP2712) TaxID=905079 RepID=L1J8S1_GUITC|nr:hypothetical protein GUITHDRAFT_94912 [Guillardia theta CCMP2712]EKX44916.1 hypothetical protein GUITHDRAFT_94912 [Guillardia theta CCMP2712]|eukprot:XP_005831896.1 hypothetical protein GUITHDRAFT_94912 [Guillardia theta CCMP2712]
MPPEALQKGRFSESSDVWSFAVTMWEVLTSGSIPYYDLSDDRAVLEHVLQGGRLPRHVIAGECPDSLWALVMRCWASSAKDRPSFSELVAALRRIREQRNKRKQAELQCEVED